MLPITTLTWLEPVPCLLLNKRLVETTGEEWILVCVHILQMVGNWGPFGHNLLPWCRGGRWPVEVVDNTLPPWAHLLCSSHLGHGINFFPNPWAKDIQISLWINRVILNLANCFVKKKNYIFLLFIFSNNYPFPYAKGQSSGWSQVFAPARTFVPLYVGR